MSEVNHVQSNQASDNVPVSDAQNTDHWHEILGVLRLAGVANAAKVATQMCEDTANLTLFDVAHCPDVLLAKFVSLKVGTVKLFAADKLRSKGQPVVRSALSQKTVRITTPDSPNTQAAAPAPAPALQQQLQLYPVFRDNGITASSDAQAMRQATRANSGPRSTSPPEKKPIMRGPPSLPDFPAAPYGGANQAAIQQQQQQQHQHQQQNQQQQPQQPQPQKPAPQPFPMLMHPSATSDTPIVPAAEFRPATRSPPLRQSIGGEAVSPSAYGRRSTVSPTQPAAAGAAAAASATRSASGGRVASQRTDSTGNGNGNGYASPYNPYLQYANYGWR